MIKKPLYDNKRSYALVSVVLFGLIFIRYCYYGFTYYYQLDDYIQYHNYTAYGDGAWAQIKALGMLSARPLAGICDLFIWAGLYSRMLIAVAVISALYAASAGLLHRVFEKHFGTGYLFFVVYALLPLGFEGTYWVSASSRIVVGLFFAALSALFFDTWCDSGKKSWLWLFAGFQLIAFCFYEQILLFSCALTLVLMLCHIRRPGRVRARWGLLMAANGLIYIIFTKLAPSGAYGDRAALYLPWQEGYLEHCFIPAKRQIGQVLLDGNVGTLIKGLPRGLKLMASEPNFIYILFMLALCFSFFMLAKRASRESIRFFAELFAGLFLAVAPLVIFFVLKSPWFGVRNIVPAFCGLALMADALFDFFFGRFKKGGVVCAGFASALALICCICAVSELHDYRETTQADTHIARSAAEAVKDISFSDDTHVWLFNVEPSYVTDSVFLYHEHGAGVTSSTWAMTGAVRALGGKEDIPDFVPISVPYTIDMSLMNLKNIRPFWYDGSGFIPAIFQNSAQGNLNIVTSSGRVLATITANGSTGYLELS